MRSSILCLLLFLQLSSFAQKGMDTKQIALLQFSNTSESCHDSLSLHAKSSSIGFIIRFYQTFFEQQDSQPCVFTPSCADYWAEAAAKKGIIAAWFMGFDRLSKCSPMNAKHYPVNNNGLMIDPLK